MKIKSLTMHNFRQFYGTTPRIEFSSGDKNTTVIHASNGGGKTAILNALTWALYEKHSAGFSFPEQIVNKRAIREAANGDNVEAYVEIQFDHDYVNYVVKRTCSCIKSSDGSSTAVNSTELTMLSSDSDGDWKAIRSPKPVIEKILPQDLHGYFFFDGERIEKIVSPDRKATDNLANATKMLLGVETLVRAERHIKDAKKVFEEELRNVGEAGTKDLLDEKNQLEVRADEIEARLRELAANIEGQEERKNTISAQLRDLKEAKALQARRDNLLEDQEKRQKSAKQNLEMQKNLISRKAYTLFLGDASSKFSSLLDKLEKRGELPAGIKLNFVDDLLNKKRCICGSSLSDPDSETFKSVVGWKERAGLADVEAQAIRMQGEITVINSEIDSFGDQMHEIQIKQKSDREELAEIENELDEIRVALKESGQQEVVDLEKRLAEAEASIKDCTREQAIKENELQGIGLKVADIEKQVAKQELKNSRQRLLQRRIEASADSAALVNDLRNIMEKGMRLSLAERIKKLFSKISVTPYIPELTDKYELKLTERAGGTTAIVPASTGESQILSFSFIGSIVEEAKEWVKKQSVVPGPSGSQYPIVMDSPFGSLDKTNRRKIAEHLNILADQVILLLTKTQWEGVVQTAVAPKIGKEYVISYHSPKEEVIEESITIEGNNYYLVKQSPDNYEYSTIQQV